MTSLVTGASGFIGRRLVEMLVARGETVCALCRNAYSLDGLGNNVIVLQGDILDESSIERAIRGCDRVFHLAAHAKNWARNAGDYFAINVKGTENVLRAAINAGVNTFVHTSSVVTIGPSNGVPIDESFLRTTPPLTQYEASKSAAEQRVLSAVTSGLRAITVNPTRVFGLGPLNEANSLTKLIKMYLEGKWHVIPGDGEALGNYSFVDDVALGHILAAERGRAGERYILGGENLSYNSLFAMVEELSGKHHRLVHVPARLTVAVSYAEEFRARVFRGYPNITPGWSKMFLLNAAYSCSRAERELGYCITPARDALRRTIEWLVNAYHIEKGPARGRERS